MQSCPNLLSPSQLQSNRQNVTADPYNRDTKPAWQRPLTGGGNLDPGHATTKQWTNESDGKIPGEECWSRFQFWELMSCNMVISVFCRRLCIIDFGLEILNHRLSTFNSMTSRKAKRKAKRKQVVKCAFQQSHLFSYIHLLLPPLPFP